MAKRDKQPPAGGVLGLLEESVGLLRASRSGTLGCYYIGTLPFVLTLLYFLTDVTQSTFASERLMEGSAILAGAFIWMKFWHAVFAGRLMDQLCGQAPERWRLGRICRVIVGQAAVQPWGLFLIPLATMVIIPLPWTYAFFQNACVYGDGRDRPGPKPMVSAWRQTMIWPVQNIAVIGILSLFGTFVLINIAMAIYQLPGLAKTFLDIDTIFTRSGYSVLNSTYLTIVATLGYLCLDPLVKAFYTLRCFYGQSLQTGQDLRGELRALISVGCLAVCLVLLGAPAESRGENSPPPGNQAASVRTGGEISPQDLDKSLDEVVARRKYAWRLDNPEEPQAPAEEGSFVTSALETVWGWIKSALEWAWEMLKKIWDFIVPSGDDGGRSGGESSPGASPGAGRGESSWVILLRYIVYAALGGIVIMMLVVFWKRIKRSQSEQADVSAAGLPTIDLEDENVTADDLPESGWLDLARQLIDQGDARLALRAMYLASLAMLADNSRISIAKFKSNMDYRRELDRRCHSMPQLLDAFGRNVAVFEAVWYGTHEATSDKIEAFIDNQKTIGHIVSNA
jgi:hypothetical protein